MADDQQQQQSANQGFVPNFAILMAIGVAFAVFFDRWAQSLYGLFLESAEAGVKIGQVGLERLRRRWHDVRVSIRRLMFVAAITLFLVIVAIATGKDQVAAWLLLGLALIPHLLAVSVQGLVTRVLGGNQDAAMAISRPFSVPGFLMFFLAAALVVLPAPLRDMTVIVMLVTTAMVVSSFTVLRAKRSNLLYGVMAYSMVSTCVWGLLYTHVPVIRINADELVGRATEFGGFTASKLGDHKWHRAYVKNVGAELLFEAPTDRGPVAAYRAAVAAATNASATELARIDVLRHRLDKRLIARELEKGTLVEVTFEQPESHHGYPRQSLQSRVLDGPMKGSTGWLLKDDIEFERPATEPAVVKSATAAPPALAAMFSQTATAATVPTPVRQQVVTLKPGEFVPTKIVLEAGQTYYVRSFPASRGLSQREISLIRPKIGTGESWKTNTFGANLDSNGYFGASDCLGNRYSLALELFYEGDEPLQVEVTTERW